MSCMNTLYSSSDGCFQQERHHITKFISSQTAFSLYSHGQITWSPGLNPTEHLRGAMKREIHIIDLQPKEKFAATVWCCHVSMDRDFPGMFPALCWISKHKELRIWRKTLGPIRYQEGISSECATSSLHKSALLTTGAFVKRIICQIIKKLCQYVLIIYLSLPPGSVRLRPIKLYLNVYGPALVNQPFPPHKAAVIMVPLTWHEMRFVWTARETKYKHESDVWEWAQLKRLKPYPQAPNHLICGHF